MRLSVSPLAIKPASFQAARAANTKKAAGTSGLLRDSLDAISGRIDAISNGGPASGNPRNYDGRSLERKPESGRPRAERPLSAWLWLRQKAHPAQDARARRPSFPREIRECGVPTRVIGKQQTTGTEAGICLPELPNHVLVGMQTIVDEYVDAFELRQQLRQDLARISRHHFPARSQPVGYHPAQRSARRQVFGVVQSDRIQGALSIQMQSKQQVCRRNPVCDSGFHHQVRAERPHSRILRQYFFCVQVGALNLQISKIRFCVFNGLGECGEAQRLIEEPADCRGGYVRQPAEKTLIGKRRLAPERMESVARVFEGVPQSSA